MKSPRPVVKWFIAVFFIAVVPIVAVIIWLPEIEHGLNRWTRYRGRLRGEKALDEFLASHRIERVEWVHRTPDGSSEWVTKWVTNTLSGEAARRVSERIAATNRVDLTWKNSGTDEFLVLYREDGRADLVRYIRKYDFLWFHRYPFRLRDGSAADLFQ